MIHVQTLTSHMQFPADVQELQTPPLATRHRQVMSRRVPGDTTESNTEKSNNSYIYQKVIFPLMQISNSDIITNTCISTQIALQNN